MHICTACTLACKLLVDSIIRSFNLHSAGPAHEITNLDHTAPAQMGPHLLQQQHNEKFKEL